MSRITLQLTLALIPTHSFSFIFLHWKNCISFHFCRNHRPFLTPLHPIFIFHKHESYKNCISSYFHRNYHCIHPYYFKLSLTSSAILATTIFVRWEQSTVGGPIPTRVGDGEKRRKGWKWNRKNKRIRSQNSKRARRWRRLSGLWSGYGAVFRRHENLCVGRRLETMRSMKWPGGKLNEWFSSQGAPLNNLPAVPARPSPPLLFLPHRNRNSSFLFFFLL